MWKAGVRLDTYPGFEKNHIILPPLAQNRSCSASPGRECCPQGQNIPKFNSLEHSKKHLKQKKLKFVLIHNFKNSIRNKGCHPILLFKGEVYLF